MEEYPSSMNNKPANPKPNPLHASTFLNAKVLIVFLIIAIPITIFLLSKNNSKIPTKTALQGQALQNKSISPSPANFSPVVFQYDTEKAKTLLAQYIKDTIKPEFLPSKIEIKQGLSIDGRTENIKYEFGSMFTTNQASFSANFHYKEGINVPNDFTFFIEPENITQTTATVSLANSLLSSYFTNPYAISDCQAKKVMLGDISYCESFQTMTGGKKGYGIIFMNSTSKLTSIVFNCFVPKESKDYDTQKSCIRTTGY